MAKNLKAFMEKASQDKGLAKKVSKAKNAEELRSIMASEGFELTDSDINNVSGGLLGDPLVKLGNVTIDSFLSSSKREAKQTIGETNLIGDNSQVNIDQKTNF